MLLNSCGAVGLDVLPSAADLADAETVICWCWQSLSAAALASASAVSAWLSKDRKEGGVTSQADTSTSHCPHMANNSIPENYTWVKTTLTLQLCPIHRQKTENAAKSGWSTIPSFPLRFRRHEGNGVYVSRVSSGTHLLPVTTFGWDSHSCPRWHWVQVAWRAACLLVTTASTRSLHHINNRHKAFTCSSGPDCLATHELAAGFTARLLSQHQMTIKTEGKYEQGKCFFMFSCAACC